MATNQSNNTKPPLADVTGSAGEVVARLKLPLSVRILSMSVDAFTKIHGLGLVMRENPEGWLEILKPTDQTLPTPATTSTPE